MATIEAKFCHKTVRSCDTPVSYSEFIYICIKRLRLQAHSYSEFIYICIKRLRLQALFGHATRPSVIQSLYIYICIKRLRLQAHNALTIQIVTMYT